jgi:hypothetical protein
VEIVGHEIDQLLDDGLIETEIHGCCCGGGTPKLDLLGSYKTPKLRKEDQVPFYDGDNLVIDFLLDVRKDQLSILIESLKSLKSVELLTEELHRGR